MADGQDTASLFPYKCKRCGVAFGGHKRQFCTAFCRVRHRHPRVGRHRLPILKCQHCQKEFRPKQRDRMKFCSRECGFKGLKRNRSRLDNGNLRFKQGCLCVICGRLTLNKSVCSPACRLLYDRQLAKMHRTYANKANKACSICDAIFAGRKIDKMCSDKCRQKAIAQWNADCKLRRRARLAKCKSSPYSRRAIFKRDGWTCRLCGKPLDRSKQCPHPLAPSIDHIIALANGGDDTPENVQAAHFICNSYKGAN